MKVAIAASPLHSGSSTRGVGTYTRELLTALSASFPQDKFIPLTRDYYAFGVDLVHFPFFDPFFLTLPLIKRLPTVITIHDLIPLKYPEHFPRGIRGSLKWMVQKLAATKVDHIITDSEASKQDIVRILGVPDERVTVIPLAPSSAALDSRRLALTKKKYNLPARYLLYVGDINWNKNVTGLIESFAALNDPDLHLVLVGKEFSGSSVIPERQALIKSINDSGCRDRIHLVGYVPASDLASIYAQATLYVQPSWDEGFGLTILEAMRVGCPVVSSNRGSLPEVAGEAAIYFDPARDMSQIIALVLADSKLRDSLKLKGQSRLRHFSWAKSASETRQVYEKILHQH